MKAQLKNTKRKSYPKKLIQNLRLYSHRPKLKTVFKTVMKKEKTARDSNRTSGAKRQNLQYERELRTIISLDDSLVSEIYLSHRQKQINKLIYPTEPKSTVISMPLFSSPIDTTPPCPRDRLPLPPSTLSLPPFTPLQFTPPPATPSPATPSSAPPPPATPPQFTLPSPCELNTPSPTTVPFDTFIKRPYKPSQEKALQKYLNTKNTGQKKRGSSGKHSIELKITGKM